MKKFQSGLTLLELAAWMLIAGVAALLAGPHYLEKILTP